MRIALALMATVVTLVPAGRAGAQGVREFLPAPAAHCDVTEPPPASGIAATPGGFIMVHPRNEGLTDDYTGCKVIWVVDVDRFKRMATLYFEDGTLARAIAHDVRSALEAIEAACDLKAGRSLLPGAGLRITDAGCRDFAEPSYGLRLATWPRRCLTEPDAPACRADPR